LLNEQKRAIEKKLEEGADSLTREQIYFYKSQLSACFEKLKGIPKPISDFTINCRFKLHTADESVHRLVTITNRNDNGKSSVTEILYRLAPKNIARLAEFREWMYSTGRGVWKGGDEDLQFLVQDMDQNSYLRDIFEVNLYGWHKESGIWFFADCAFVSTDAGIKRIEADSQNIFWWEGVGYQIDSSIDARGTTFGQGAPLLLAPQDRSKKESGTPQEIFPQLAQDLFDTIGSYEGWLALGITLAYGAAPELLKIGGHPGLWLYGKMSGGKTTIARWLMRIWGFKDLPGMSLAEGSTHVAVTRFLAQYSCLPFWFDEFRKDQVDDTKVYCIRHAFDRGGSGKGQADYTNRTRVASANTTPMITGETGSTDGATRSRYAQVQVSKYNRIGDGHTRYLRMQEDCKNYYQIGRFLMENRTEFVRMLMETLSDWMINDEVKEAIPNDRVRLVHGTAYAAMDAMDNLLKLKTQNLGQFFTFLKEHGKKSLQDVIEETFINTFWRDVSAGLLTGKILSKFFSVTFVAMQPDGTLQETDHFDEDARAVLYLAPAAVFNMYAQDKRGRNENVPLDVNSLGREISKEPYWLAPPRNKTRVHRKTIDGNRTSCWAISLEKENDRYLFPYAEDMLPRLCDGDMMKILVAKGVLDSSFKPE